MTFLAIALMMFAASGYAQLDEDVASPEDSLQITEEAEIPTEDISSPVDSLQITEEAEIPTEDIPSPPDSLQITEEAEIPTEVITPRTIPSDPSSVLQEFFQALKTGDTFMISQLISSDGLDGIEVMLEILKENLDDNEETIMSRLTTAGYTVTADEIDDWSPIEYLTNTIVLPVMKARYAFYEMQIGDYSDHGSELIIPLVFRTTSGVELPYQAVLVKEDNQWRVTDFMGLNSFP
ncbi:MAG: hypothetical protein KAT09_03150 [Candidatus Aegiribacteria sp.]|nr:hypothetical protein [Candidatus Aegiribacteria sp.]